MAISKILRSVDALNGQKGTFYFTPKFGKYKGRQIELFDLVSFGLNMDVNDTTREVLNGTSTQHIDEQTNLAWNATVYNVRSYLVEMAIEKKKNKVPIIGDVVVSNNMSNTDMGVQTVNLIDFEIKSINNLIGLDVNNHDMTTDLSGYVEDIDLISAFNDLDIAWSED